VATRRAAAALQTFADLLPAKLRRRTAKALRCLRRAAGAARDADVFLDTLRGWSVNQSPAARPGLHFLLGHFFALRQAAQITLENVIMAALADPLPDLERKVHGGDETLGERAVCVLTDLLHDLTAAARTNLEDYERLHRVRILGKRLRYALELFIDCFAAPVREQVYSQVEIMQDILGLANDSQQTSLRVEVLSGDIRRTHPGLWDLFRVGLEDLRAYHLRRLKEQRAAFAEWWHRWEALRPAELLSRVTAPASSASVATTAQAAEPGGRS
jgi:CHAD domain-containing protein